MLPEERRKQLDDIIQQMITNKETDNDIQFVVEDFKSKYDQLDFTEPPTTMQPAQRQGTFLDKIVGDVKDRGKNLLDIFRQTEKGQITPIETGVQSVGQVIGGAGDVFGSSLIGLGKALLPKSAEQAIATGATKTLETLKVPEVLNKYENWKKKNPRAAADLEGVVNIASLLPVEKVAAPILKGGKKLASEAAEATIKTTKKVLKPRQSIDEIVGQITQGTTKEIKQATKALSVVDISDIADYSDLKNATKNTIKTFAEKQDELLSKIGQTHSMDELVRSVRVGNQTVKQNFVDDALNQFQEFYQKTNNLKDLARIKNLKNKAAKQGLTTQEVNQIARDYGSEFTQKAFSKIGEPLTSINKVAAENTREGIKETARNLLPDKSSKLLDTHMSNLYVLERTAEKMETAVQKLSNKVVKRKLLEKVGRKIGQTADIFTGRALSGFLNSFVKSNVGLKTLNALDLEGRLHKNLKKINKLIKTGDDGSILKYIDDVIKKNPRLALPAPKPGTPKSQIMQSINLPSRTQSTIDQEEMKRILNQLLKRK